MSFNPQSERIESLNAFRNAIHHGTHGLIRDLRLALMDDDRIVVHGSSRSYYGVQLAIHTTEQFGRSQRPFPETQLLLSIDGTTLELVITPALNRKTRVAQSIRVAPVAPS